MSFRVFEILSESVSSQLPLAFTSHVAQPLLSHFSALKNLRTCFQFSEENLLLTICVSRSNVGIVIANVSLACCFNMYK